MGSEPEARGTANVSRIAFIRSQMRGGNGVRQVLGTRHFGLRPVTNSYFILSARTLRRLAPVPRITLTNSSRSGPNCGPILLPFSLPACAVLRAKLQEISAPSPPASDTGSGQRMPVGAVSRNHGYSETQQGMCADLIIAQCARLRAPSPAINF